MAAGEYGYMRVDATSPPRRIPLGRRHILLLVALACAGIWTLYSWTFIAETFGLGEQQSQVGLDTGVDDQDGPAVEAKEDVVPVVAPGPHWAERAEQVKQAFVHAYAGYERYASPADELLPLSNRSTQNFNGWGVTMFDSLDTMWLMGLKDDFNRALIVVEQTNFEMQQHKQAQFFETVIRYLGGLLSAYALSGAPILLMKADQLGDALGPAFSTESGFPVYSVNTETGMSPGGYSGSLAEIASCQLEYLYLARVTGKKAHFDRGNGVIQAMAKANTSQTGGMLPTHFYLTTGAPSSKALSIGAMADSGHEYILKQYLLTAKTDKASLEMYIRMTTYVLGHMLYLSPERELLYITDIGDYRQRPTHKLEHLSCFFPGLLALGAHTLPLDDLASAGVDFQALAASLPESMRAVYAGLAKYSLKDLHLWAAEGLAQTCWLTYADMASGLAPDEVQMHTMENSENVLWMDAVESWRGSGARGAPPGTKERKPIVYTQAEKGWSANRETGRDRDYDARNRHDLLRPETIESLYLLWRVTGDERWRERGWQIFEAIERSAKVPSGYASLSEVDEEPAPHLDMMPSFFLAETLKYLYLLCKDEDPVPLDKWVFNTEAHPLPVFEWTQEEKTIFGVVS